MDKATRDELRRLAANRPDPGILDRAMADAGFSVCEREVVVDLLAATSALLDALDAAEARAADARRATLEEAAAYLEKQASASMAAANVMTNSLAEFWLDIAEYEREHAATIRDLITKDH